MVVTIPIGFRCMTSMFLRYHNFQQLSLPFDWVGAPLPAITAALRDELRQMLRPEDVAPFRDAGVLGEGERTIINAYGMACTHVFKKQLPAREQVKEVLVTAKRRSDRLLALLRSEEKVVFVRHQNEGCAPPSLEEWEDFLTVVREKFPTLQFKVLYVQVGNVPPVVPPEVKVLTGDHSIIPVGGKFESPDARLPEVMRKWVTRLRHELSVTK